MQKRDTPRLNINLAMFMSTDYSFSKRTQPGALLGTPKLPNKVILKLNWHSRAGIMLELRVSLVRMRKKHIYGPKKLLIKDYQRLNMLWHITQNLVSVPVWIWRKLGDGIEEQQVKGMNELLVV